jgi:tellurite resistance protein
MRDDHRSTFAPDTKRSRRLVDAVCLSALADGTVTDREIEALSELLPRLPPFHEWDDATRVHRALEEGFERVSFRGPDVVREQVVEALRDTPGAELAFMLAVVVQMRDDHVYPDVHDEIFALGESLGLGSEEMEGIVAEIEYEPSRRDE